ncbi:MAG: CAP domain-containing protein [Candidatus Peregrinibacteria bacterium]|nr:CAP domain-containing protein [Candidatus Peregrinibacteria bacterium]MCB9807726.1 CAP domain-containing protein [Candidatus Peribacteria bacterium]
MRKSICSLLAVFLLGSLATFRPVSAEEPVAYVHREEAVMLLLKNAGIPYESPMAKAIELGMIDDLYPNASVSRAEFLSMLTNVFGLTTHIPYQFTDIDKTAWYTPYIGLAWRYKLFVSDSNPTLLLPDMRITHAEATEALYTLLRAEPSLQPKPNMFPVHKEQPIATKPTFLQSISNATVVKKAMLNLIRNRGNQAGVTRNELIDAVNDIRARYKLEPLSSNYYLELAAQRHAKDMFDRGYFSHFTPEGFSYVERIKRTGYISSDPRQCSCPAAQKGPDFVVGRQSCSCEPSFSLGENLAKGQLSVEEVMEDWLNSENHRKNILRPQFSEIGIGLFGDIWVQEFGHLELK